MKLISIQVSFFEANSGGRMATGGKRLEPSAALGR
jgi:hypothetical protein